MKKIFTVIIFTIFPLILTSQVTQQQVNAGSKYSITDYDTSIKVKKDGSADIVQKVTYKFTGKFHVIQYSQQMNGHADASLPRVQLFEDGNEIPLKYGNGNNSYQTFGLSGVTTDESPDQINATIRHESSDAKVTAVYKYNIVDLVTNYNDIAEINWKVISSDWDSSMKHVHIKYQLPESNISNLHSWVKVQQGFKNRVNAKSGVVDININNYSNHQSLSSRLIFPTSVTPNNQNITRKNMKSKILASETQIERKQKVLDVSYFVIIGIFALIIILLFVIIHKRINTNKYQDKYKINNLDDWFDIPEVSPSMAKIILTQNETADLPSFIGELLVQVNKNNIKISKIDNTYEIELMHIPEDDFFTFLVTKIGANNKVTTQQISDYQGVDLYYEFQKWKNRAAQGRARYIDVKNTNAKSGLANVASLSSIFAAIVLIATPFLFGKFIWISTAFAALAIVVPWIIYYIGKHKITSYTPLGEQTAAKLIAFKKMLGQIDDLGTAKVGDLVLWEKILPYAVAFEVSQNVLQQLRVDFGDSISDDSNLALYYALGAGTQVGFLGSLAGAMYPGDNAGFGNIDGLGNLGDGGFGGNGGGSSGGAY
ncbi:DUF2207 domain-containing protein [Companilactobacillus ginsenosidimutans]|uniref:DUF2207 domain-containing protein n=1 Tax=Companilactobacillus ginsenosidimutans TaxID=1007676 RepID=A0A0H4QYL2_9LACO|nr:DUF2207 domain-containing protein [Companilactobacillus ginsenosidimutans]AKP66565.1 hypothetical protein ABM34_02680 [Companilactobacillus ginsenosidimutans]